MWDLTSLQHFYNPIYHILIQKGRKTPKIKNKKLINRGGERDWGLTFCSMGEQIKRLIFLRSTKGRWDSKFCTSTSVLSSNMCWTMGMISIFNRSGRLFLDIHSSISRSLTLIFIIIFSVLSVANCLYVWYMTSLDHQILLINYN